MGIFRCEGMGNREWGMGNGEWGISLYGGLSEANPPKTFLVPILQRGNAYHMDSAPEHGNQQKLNDKQ